MKTPKKELEKPQAWKAKRSLFEKRADDKRAANAERRKKNWK